MELADFQEKLQATNSGPCLFGVQIQGFILGISIAVG